MSVRFLGGNVRQPNVTFSGIQPVTVACWILPELLPQTTIQWVFGQSNDAGDGFENILQLDSSGQIGFYAYDGSARTAIANGFPLRRGAWYHVCGTNRNGGLEIFVDGVLRGTTFIGALATGSGRRWFVGNHNGGAIAGTYSALNSTLRDCTAWFGRLSAAEIALLAAGASPLHIQPNNIIVYHALRNGAEGVDSGPNKRFAYISGAWLPGDANPEVLAQPRLLPVLPPTDDAILLLTLTPSTADIKQSADSGTVSLTLTPSATEGKRTEVFPSTSVVDDFNRADESPLSQSGSWDATWGSWLSLELISNVVGSSTFDRRARLRAGTLPNNQEAYCKVTTLPVGTDGFPHGVVVRATNPGGNPAGYVFGWSSSTVLKLYRANGDGGLTELASYTVTLATNDQLGLSAVDDVLYCWRKPAAGSWGLVGTVRDSTFSSGKIGLTGYSSQFRFDDFGGGAVPSLDSDTPRLVLTPSALEDRTSSDAATALVKLSPGVGEEFIEAQHVYLIPSGTELVAYADATTAILALTASSTDLANYVDSRTATIVFTPSAHECFFRYTPAFTLYPSVKWSFTDRNLWTIDKTRKWGFSYAGKAADLPEC